MKISKKFLRMAPIYKLFAQDLPMVSFTKEDLEEAYRVESTGYKPKDSNMFPKKATDTF